MLLQIKCLLKLQMGICGSKNTVRKDDEFVKENNNQ